MSAVTVTKSSLPWLLSLSLTIMFARSPEALGYPQSSRPVSVYRGRRSTRYDLSSRVNMKRSSERLTLR